MESINIEHSGQLIHSAIELRIATVNSSVLTTSWPTYVQESYLLVSDGELLACIIWNLSVQSVSWISDPSSGKVW